MIETLDIQNSAGAVLTLTFDDDSSGYVIQSIDGLDPVKATLSSSTFANLDGEQYQNGRRETRNIIITLGLSPDYVSGQTVENLRSDLYAYFMPKATVGLTFNRDDGTSYLTNGVVETFTSPLFAQEPTVQISIICYNPDFSATDSLSIDGFSYTQPDPLSPPPDPDPADVYYTVHYNGTVPTGILFTITGNQDDLGGFTLYCISPDGSGLSMDYNGVGDGFNNGDVVTINTNVGQKDVRAIGGDLDISGLPGLDIYADWIQLQPGDNQFQVYIPGFVNPVPFTIEYTEKFGGL